MPFEQWLKTASPYEQRLASIWHDLHSLKEAYANTPPDKRGEFPA